MTWPSAAALAQIHAKILDAGFDCNVEIVTGDTVPTTSSMVLRGSPAVAPELWTSTVQDQWDAAVNEGSDRRSRSVQESPRTPAFQVGQPRQCRAPT
ncbi:glycine betaine ABC transporter substrate-binding protein [Devosia psychrophila]|nr:glycine betaine ABC transporter substrate-binding protein [Devosia psychrophila]